MLGAMNSNDSAGGLYKHDDMDTDEEKKHSNEDILSPVEKESFKLKDGPNREKMLLAHGLLILWQYLEKAKKKLGRKREESMEWQISMQNTVTSSSCLLDGYTENRGALCFSWFWNHKCWDLLFVTYSRYKEETSSTVSWFMCEGKSLKETFQKYCGRYT